MYRGFKFPRGICRDELDEDIVTFAGNGLDEIFPDEDKDVAQYSDVDMAEALTLLDQEDDESDLESLVDFVDDEELPEL